MNGLLALALLAGAPAPSPSAAPSATPVLPRAAVISVGDDPSVAGQMQKDFERALGTAPGIAWTTGSQSATRLTVAKPAAVTPAGPDAAAKEQAAKLLEGAKSAYYDDASAKALDALAKLEALQEQVGGFPILQRIEMRLWRSAVFLALKDEQQASDEALTALSLDPELKIDLKELPPSVSDELETVRKTRLKIVTVILSGLPPVAQISVDGRSVPSRFKAAAGHHKVVIGSPGRLDVTREFDAATDVSISISLPLAAPAGVQASIAAIVQPATPQDRPDLAPLTQLATTVQADWLVLVWSRATPAETRVIVVPASGLVAPWVSDPTPTGTTTAASMAEKVLAKVRDGIAQAAAKGKSSRVSGGAETPGWHTALRGGLAWDGRFRTLSGSGGSSVKTFFAGTGPALGIGMGSGAKFVDVSLAWTTYGLSSLQVTLPDGTKHSATGGSTTAIAAGGGLRTAFGAGSFEDDASIHGGIFLLAERHQATDVSSASGAKLGVLTSYTRIAPEIRAGARFPVGSGETPIAILADVGVAPAGLWLDSPSKVNGTSSRAVPAISWRFGAALGEGTRWSLTADYAGESKGADYKGTSSLPSNPPIANAHVRETVQTVTFGVLRRF